jgi:two-component system sensor histidine kinase/response regulator
MEDLRRANQELEQRVAELSAALEATQATLERRSAELALVNSVQEGLAAQLDMQAIFDLVGDKIRAIFDAQVVDIGVYDQDSGLLHFPYWIERGVRYTSEPLTLFGFRKFVIEQRQPLVINSDALKAVEAFGNPKVIWGEMAQSLVFIPLLVGDEARGYISIQDLDREHAFSETDVQLLSTLAASLSVAIENARLFAEAARARHAAESASRAKSAFLANMSHELRTPLNAVLGFAQVLERDETLSARQREHLSLISRSGEYLLGLINSVLEVSKIEAGRLSLSPVSFDLHDLLQSVAELFRLRAEAKGLELIAEVAPEVPQYVEGDEGKLRQVLINLLSNAVKFTHTGGVRLRAASHPGEPPRLAVEVTDTGEGIDDEQLPRLFEAFAQTDSGLKAHEGSGLGLAISRQYVQLMGGEITVSSRPGEGSSFRFEIALPPTSGAAVRPRVERRVRAIDPDDRREYRLLVVDDRWESRRLMVEWLSRVGFDVREAANGVEALAIWEAWEPHLIWMDVRMPVMDGYEATKRIKATLKGQATVVIALTASAFDHERAQVLSIGCDDFVRKPVREAIVFDKLVEHLRVRFVYDELVTPVATPAAPAPTGADERISALPPELRATLRDAALTADIDVLQTLIARTGAYDSALADYLTCLVDSYLIDQLQLLMQAADRAGPAATMGDE